MIPAKFTCGDTLKFDVAESTLADGTIVSPANGWTLAFKIGGVDGTPAVVGSAWKVTFSSANTAAMTAGVLAFAITATKAGERHTIDAGTIRALPDLSAAAAGYEARSTAQKNLDLVNAAITARLSGGSVAEYTIGSRSLRYSPISELLLLKGQLEREVEAENAAARVAAGLKSGKRIGVRFG